MTEDERRAELVSGLRELADWYEKHPKMPLPSYPDFAHCVLAADDKSGKAEVRKIASILGVKPHEHENRLSVDRKFDGIAYSAFYVYRAHVAEYNAGASYLYSVTP
jgi:hypothetical protein